MTNILTQFLSPSISSSGYMRDYRHAEQMYGGNSMSYMPKFGWLYYVSFNINKSISVGGNFSGWVNEHSSRVGLLAKKVITPKFSIQNEVLNQYNKKTVIQKNITYNPVSITLHDDSSNVTNDMWKYYYMYYFGDSNGSTGANSINAKFSTTTYATDAPGNFGLNNGQYSPFFSSITIYQLYSGKFNSFTLVNPIIKEWSHDQLDQTQGATVLASTVTFDYEAVTYDTGSAASGTFMNEHYDKTPSPLSIAGGGTSTIFGRGGLLSGAADIFGDLMNAKDNPLSLVTAAFKTGNLLKNAKGLTSSGIKQETKGLLTGSLMAGAVGAIGAAFKTPANAQTTAKQSGV